MCNTFKENHDLSLNQHSVKSIEGLLTLCKRKHKLLAANNSSFSYSTKRLDRAIFLYIFVGEVQLISVRVSTGIVHIRKF